MPRDSRGNPYGIGSRVNTPDGPITVHGFSVQVVKHDKARLAATVHPHRVYSWTEIGVIDPQADPYRTYVEPNMGDYQANAPRGETRGGAQSTRVEFADSVDTCMADVVQRSSGVDGGPGPFRAGAQIQVSADKAVWGS